MDPNWIPLLEYALKNRISVSTLRRHIKSGKVQFKLARGKYLIAQGSTASHDTDGPSAGDSDETARLRLELRQAQEEIAELKTLIALYEERAPERSEKIGRC